MNIWKFPLEVVDTQTISMPLGATILTVQVQAGVACLWALVEPRQNVVPRRIRIVGTGHESDGPAKYIGTFQLMDGGLIFHVFELAQEGDRGN